ncbi:AfsR/SARP family transcriptional regulator [Actinoalloteichus hymeniacidonis]|uniref:DNA-binding transcriptional activator of the SARP family n=1 Tax=Actinoalloteichus hymeniacidonis TaxID=340345 RepID=A0AAC9HPF4_9PSEU|nr:BTAD domain-containing putative transcriptional regulator [Actinoalloteichus hymeniacidonis]AOS62150.1 DNA-binding transcriptional activator of the SARP family [Actinoalloteichus hymeniacidonis]MBB5909828.1 DNA-binding SARP family transcriptional activator [Actinoalloteichus hymeniacidonis]
MRFRLLGPLEIRAGAEWVSPESPQQRLTLAVLLLNAPHPISEEKLLDELWSEVPPADGAAAVRKDVEDALRFLADHGGPPILRTAEGYRIDVDPKELDLTAFNDFVEQGAAAMQDGRFREATRLFEAARGLWRDTPFSDVPAAPIIVAERPRIVLTMRRCQFGIIDARLALDDLADLPGEIEAELARHPLSEELWIRKALVSNQLGRRTEALDAFHQAHVTLATELGIEPGEELRRARVGVLEGESPAALLRMLGIAVPTSAVSTLPTTPRKPDSSPSEIPPVSPFFEGRSEELTVLGDLLAAGDPRASTAVAITGMAGSGKTTLAVRGARAAAEQYPDGQVFVHLRGHNGDEPLSPLAAVSKILYALGIPGNAIPTDLDEATAHYHAVVAERRLLILADDARAADQVNPLVPQHPGSRLIVTARSRLDGLTATGGVRSLPLDPLSDAASRALLTEIIGTDSVDRPDLLPTLVQLGAGLPLSLRILGAQLRDDPSQRFEELTRRLGSGGLLTALEIHGEPASSVRTALDQSYATLSEDTRLAFRRLSWLPDPVVDARATAVVLDCDVEAADRLLSRLADGQLVQQHSTGRFRLHDAVRVYAEERSQQEDSPDERATAVHRVLRWHLGRAWAAIGRDRAFCPTGIGEELAEFDESVFTLPAGWTMLRWWDIGRPVIAAAARSAMQHGLHRLCWMLSYCLTTYLQQRLRLAEWQEASALGTSAAMAADDNEGRAWLKNAEGKLFVELGRLPEAIDAIGESIATFCRLGNAEAELMVMTNLGIARCMHGDRERGVELLERSVAQSQRLGLTARLHVGLNNLTMAYLQVGRIDDAIASGRRSLEVLTGLDYPLLNDDRGRALDSLGQAYRRADLLHKAVQAHSAALRDFEIADNSVDRIVCLNNLAECHRLLGNRDSAIAMFSLALDYQRIAEDSWSILAGLGRLGVELIDAGRASEARKPLSEAVALLRDLDAARSEELAELLDSSELADRAGALSALFAAAQRTDHQQNDPQQNDRRPAAPSE